MTDKKVKKVKVRGTGTYDPETQKFGFEPFNEAPSTQTNVRTCKGGGKTWETTGTDPSRMLTLKCKVKEADQYAELARQFHQLTRDLQPKRPIEPPAEQRVVSEDGLDEVNTKMKLMTYRNVINFACHIPQLKCRQKKENSLFHCFIYFHSIMNDFTTELAKLHELSGGLYSRQVEQIAHRKEFHPLDSNKNIFAVGGESSDDYQNLLTAARKAVEFGYKVYILPNPRSIRTADLILEKKGTFRMYDLKTVFGKASVGQNLIQSIGQCNRILLNMKTEYNTRSLAFDIKRFFEINDKAIEVLIFKGCKRISVNRVMVHNESFLFNFKRIYER